MVKDNSFFGYFRHDWASLVMAFIYYIVSDLQTWESRESSLSEFATLASWWLIWRWGSAEKFQWYTSCLCDKYNCFMVIKLKTGWGKKKHKYAPQKLVFKLMVKQVHDDPVVIIQNPF